MPEHTLKRLSDKDRHARVQSVLTRLDELIGVAKARVAEHAAQMATLEKCFPELHAVSRKLHHNLEEALNVLIDQRVFLLRELAYIERRKNVAIGLYFKLGEADQMLSKNATAQ